MSWSNSDPAGRKERERLGAPERSPSMEPRATSTHACAGERVLHGCHWGEWRGRELRQRRPQWLGSGGENDRVREFIQGVEISELLAPIQWLGINMYKWAGLE
jgi:hypothetical protein